MNNEAEDQELIDNIMRDQELATRDQELADNVMREIIEENPRARRESKKAYQARIIKLVGEQAEVMPDLLEAMLRSAAREALAGILH